MSTRSYYSAQGGHPAQTELMTGRAIFTNSYAVLPKGVMRDIVASALPHWDKTRAWILSRPMSGFAETFAQYVMEVLPDGGSDAPEPEPGAEAVIFVMSGEVTIKLRQAPHVLRAGGYAYLPPSSEWSLRVESSSAARFIWIRKLYAPVPGISFPDPVFTNDADVTPDVMPASAGLWSTTRFVDASDLRHDMHVNIVNLDPGASIPFEETHVMEHGLYVLEGKGVYRLNQDWVEVEAGDFIWLRAFCPQACYAGGPGRFRYLLYKDVNRHPKLQPSAESSSLSHFNTLERYRVEPKAE